MSKERKPKLTRIERIMRLPIRVGTTGCYRSRPRSTLSAFRWACDQLRKKDKEKASEQREGNQPPDPIGSAATP
jgi:hypothetical protein